MRFAPSFLLASLLVAPAALANPLSDVTGGTTTSYSQFDSTYLVGGVSREFSQRRLMLDYSEMGNGWFYGGLSVAYTMLDGSTETLIADDNVPGAALGVFGGVVKRYFDGRLGLHLEARYLREWDSGEITGGDETSVNIGEGSVRLGASWRFKAMAISAGAYSLSVTGDVERSGVLIGSADLKGSDSSGGYAGLEIKLDGGYALGFRAETGARETLALTFSTGF